MGTVEDIFSDRFGMVVSNTIHTDATFQQRMGEKAGVSRFVKSIDQIVSVIHSLDRICTGCRIAKHIFPVKDFHVRTNVEISYVTIDLFQVSWSNHRL